MPRTDSPASDVFDAVLDFPDPQAQRAYERLAGLDLVKERLAKEAHLLIRPTALEEWSQRQHSESLPLLDYFRDRPPLFVFAGDVGTGKTELAETFGDRVAREERAQVTLYRLSLAVRGSGAVGEMTTLIRSAFAEVAEHARRAGGTHSKGGVVILLIDEADALAQSRELAQMHHEDRAGVNALVRGVSDLARARLPVLVVMCTNRLSALDPAIRRRAADVFTFSRPDESQRAEVVRRLFDGVRLTGEQIRELAVLTGETNGRSYGCTYSDLTQRLVADAVLAAYPDGAIRFDTLKRLVQQLVPSPPFEAEAG